MIEAEAIEHAKRVKVANVLLKKDLFTFTRYFYFKQYKRKYADWEHLRQISECLEKVLNGEIKRLIINIAPRYGKTELAVKAFIAYALAINPSAKFIHTTYSASLALDNSKEAKDLISSEHYAEIFPNVVLKKDQKSKQKWQTTAGGGVYATSSGGQITGFGAGQVDQEPEDGEDFETFLEDLLKNTGVSYLGKKALFGGAIIIDDPNKPDDADSETLRNRVNDRYDSTISNRVNSRNTPIIVIQQRTHEDDLSGYLMRKQGIAEEGGEWHVLKLASIKEDGTPLCPQKHTIEELRALEKHNDVVFQRQHMQNPKPKSGLLFPLDELHLEDFEAIKETLSNSDYQFAAADPANLGGDDFAAGLSKLVGNKIYIDDIIYNTKGSDFNEDAFAKLIIKHNPAAVGVEAVLGWVESARRIKEYIEEYDFSGEFRQLRPRTNKHSRILNRAAFIRNNFVFRSDWEERPEYAKFMRNLTSYLKIQEAGRGNKHDDAPDLCEMIAAHYEANFPHLFALIKKD